jgi:phosphatidylserine decarboxylase
MKNPAALMNPEMPFAGEMRKEVRGVDRVSPIISQVVVDGEIELRSELTIDDKGYRLRQAIGKNTTPYKFATGDAKNARIIQRLIDDECRHAI